MLTNLFWQRTLRVVGKDDAVRGRDLCGQRLQQGIDLRLVGQFGCLHVEPHQLLSPRHNARFRNGRPLPNTYRIGRDARSCQQPAQCLRRFIATQKSGQRYLRSQADQIHRNVGSAAGDMRAPRGTQHRHGRFWRDAADVAPQILVQHQVADDQHAIALKARTQPDRGHDEDHESCCAPIYPNWLRNGAIHLGLGTKVWANERRANTRCTTPSTSAGRIDVRHFFFCSMHVSRSQPQQSVR